MKRWHTFAIGVGLGIETTRNPWLYFAGLGMMFSLGLLAREGAHIVRKAVQWLRHKQEVNRLWAE